ncbi:diaminobutyrate--2-oxoglutarate transaminase [Paenibacillus athensensis]|uniref:Diaminobutyrate--2-oxoglutarate transaminase n=1 Tax=Paenibacillus athensensis TaxID=1967502 RepID=A0A4Y8Q3M5_9BACL|nr:diaminobutyrate--2-oxoglutarate transaminase [Paenibacillus athensensis]MCD1260617.1 diaminobutyrate--2-oxoglutarate transaminase [Paenibacillus athensensis]
MLPFEQLESNVRSYCRTFPRVFERAKGAHLFSEDGSAYVDFFAGAGALNYGHNPDFIQSRLVDFIQSDRIMHGLDMYTTAKREFLLAFTERILRPRGLVYKMQFCGPTGTNAVEAAIKLARKVKGRTNMFSFMGGYHGMSLGSLAATSNLDSRAGAGRPLDGVTFIPYESGGFAIDSIAYMEHLLSDTHAGVDKPAAVIVETVQAEGGVNVASADWLQSLKRLCEQHDLLLICDDVQVGCGRTGTFFSFERAGIEPDMVVLSKSIGGCGLPMSLLLLRPELDIWKPGEHNGTFRGNQLAFVAATAALELWEGSDFANEIVRKGAWLQSFLQHELSFLGDGADIRGIGLLWGIDVARVGGPALAKMVVELCFEKRLILERAGRNDTVLKLMPPLTIDMETLRVGCEVVRDALRACCEVNGVGGATVRIG